MSRSRWPRQDRLGRGRRGDGIDRDRLGLRGGGDVAGHVGGLAVMVWAPAIRVVAVIV